MENVDPSFIFSAINWIATIAFMGFIAMSITRIVTWPFRKLWPVAVMIGRFIRSFFEEPKELIDVQQIFEYGAIDRVIDGDTIVFNGRRVRILHIDAPEMGQPLTDHSDIDAGGVARDMMSLFCIRRDARLRVFGNDSHGRLLARVYVGGEDLGLKLVRDGYAIVLDGAPDEYVQAEARAKSGKLGLWGMGGFELPASWRRTHPRANKAAAAA